MKDENIYIIGDVHGHYNELICLINKLPNKFDSKICFVGDLIDRGPDSKKVVDLIKQRGYDCVMGNHEQMCIDFNGNPYNMSGGYGAQTLNLFGGNGGVATLNSYKNYELLRQDVDDFFSKLPLYIVYPEAINKDGKKLVVSHSCINNYIDENLNLVMSEFLQEDELDVVENIIWNRDLLIKNQNHIKELKKYFNVFGHTITEKPIINNKFAAIETGVANKNGGKLTCLAYPSMKIYQN